MACGEEMRQDDRFSAVACEGIMLEIVAAFGRIKTAAVASSKPPPWLRSARDFMHENAFAAISMAHFGVTPSEYRFSHC
jgi:hypothetical protein